MDWCYGQGAELAFVDSKQQGRSYDISTAGCRGQSPLERECRRIRKKLLHKSAQVSVGGKIKFQITARDLQACLIPQSEDNVYRRAYRRNGHTGSQAPVGAP